MQGRRRAKQQRHPDTDAKAGMIPGMLEGAVEFGEPNHDASRRQQCHGPHTPVDTPDDKRDQESDTKDTLYHTHQLLLVMPPKRRSRRP
jgi:hypothetical protein